MQLLLVSWFSLLFSGCAPVGSSWAAERNSDPESILSRTWQWEMTVTPLETITAANPERYTILFGENGRIQVRFDCNRGGGDYQLSRGRIAFGPMRATRMGCPPDSQGAVFMRDLQRVVSYFVENGSLYLELPNDGGTMRFRPAP
ncbi:MAG: META domain-containing protein [Gammaproteobacteria bacterium]